MFGQIESLVRKIDYSSMQASQSIKKVGNAGNAVKQSALSNAGAGGVSFAANIENQERLKKGSINAFQNAMSMMQAQSEAIGQADKLYNQMRTLAQQAADPLMNARDRSLLSQQFNDLRDRAKELGNSKFNDVYLFDGRASSTKYTIDFSSDLNETKPPIDPGPPKVWESTRDVIYNSGKITINVNSGTAGDRYMLKQGNAILFDTGYWKTEGSAYTTDFDQFIVEWGPDQETTFQFVPTDTNGSGSFNNKSWYLSQFGLSDDGTSTGMDSYIGQKLTELGAVKAYASDPNSTELTVRIESTSLFQIDSEYELPEVAPVVVARDEDYQVELNKVGLALMRENDQSRDFPLIRIDTVENAAKAIGSLSNEIEGIGLQLGRLASNFNRVQNSIEANESVKNVHQDVLSSIGGDQLTEDLLNISKARINRAHDTALLSQAMSIHQDLVNVLI